jgi:hypothetical protein
MRRWWRQITLLAISAAGGVFIFYGQGRFWLFVASVATALALYGVREIDRRLYGAIEIIFAVIALWDASEKGRGAFSADFANDFQTYQWLVILLQTGGSIYVLIRGLDNFQLARFLKEIRQIEQ